jgi:hypothetical protein
MRKEANIKEKAQKKNITFDLKEYLTDLRFKIGKDDTDRAIWKEKMITASNQRLGIKRVTNYPYENAPDIPLPETDKLIKKQTPNLVLSAWSVKKLCSVKPEEGTQVTPAIKQQAYKAEEAMNMVLRNKIDLYNKLELAADYAKEKGHCIFKIVEEFKSRKVHKIIELDTYKDEQIEMLKNATNDELRQFLSDRYNLDLEDEDDKKVVKDIIDQFRSGDDIIEFDIEEVSSYPNIEIPLPDKIFVPAYTTDINNAERITHEFFLTKHELEEKFEADIYNKKDLEKISEKNDDDVITHQKKMNEGVENSTDELYRIHETYTWYKPEGEDCYQRWVFTFLADVTDPEDSLLRMIPFPFEFDGWNFERFDNERKDARHYNSRGVPEQVRALQETMERSINNMLIRDEHNNNPLYEVVETSDILQRDSTFAPGEFVPVSQLGAEVRRMDEKQIPDVSSTNIIQLTKAFVEEYQSSTDQLFRNATNTGGGKTLGEIDRGIQKSQGSLTQEVIRWNETLSRVYTKIFYVMQDRLGDSIWINGQEITKEDFFFPAVIKSNGTLEMADQNIATQKAWLRLQAAMQMLQVGVADTEDVYNSYRDWLEKDGVKDPEDYSTNPEVIAQKKLTQMMQQIQQGGQQLEALQKELENKQKDLAKVEKKAKEEVKNFEGEMEAISDGAYSK